MNAQIQFDLFNELSEIDLLKKELEEVKTSSENVRKGIFARHNALAKLYMDLYDKCMHLQIELQKMKEK